MAEPNQSGFRMVTRNVTLKGRDFSARARCTPTMSGSPWSPRGDVRLFQRRRSASRCSRNVVQVLAEARVACTCGRAGEILAVCCRAPGGKRCVPAYLMPLVGEHVVFAGQVPPLELPSRFWRGIDEPPGSTGTDAAGAVVLGVTTVGDIVVLGVTAEGVAVVDGIAGGVAWRVEVARSRWILRGRWASPRSFWVASRGVWRAEVARSRWIRRGWWTAHSPAPAVRRARWLARPR